MPEVTERIFHLDYLLKKNDCIVVFLPQDKFFCKNESKIHEVFPDEPVGKSEVWMLHVHPLEFCNGFIVVVVEKVEENELCTAFIVSAFRKPFSVIKFFVAGFIPEWIFRVSVVRLFEGVRFVKKLACLKVG